MRETLTVWLADPSPLFREGVKSVLPKPRFTVERTGATLAEILDCPAPAPEIVVFGTSTEPAAEALIKGVREQGGAAANTRFVLLINGDLQPSLSGPLRSVVDAILPKDMPTEAVAHYFEIVSLGQSLVVLPAAATENLPVLPPMLLDSGQPPDPWVSARTAATPEARFQDDLIRLSEREREILERLTRGLSNKAIARELGISDCTVKVHMKSLLRKIRVENRTQAAVWANKARLGARLESGNGRNVSPRPTLAEAIGAIDTTSSLQVKRPEDRPATADVLPL